MSFQGGLMDQMEAAQREFLDAQRRWNADEKGDLKLLEICSDAEQRLVAAFFVGWIAEMRLKNLAYSHFRKALVPYNGAKVDGAKMQIGEPVRTIVMEPLELPVSDPRRDPISQPEVPKSEPEPEPGQVPASR